MDDADRREHERAGTAYILWPLAFVTLARETPAASMWSRIHTRQAMAFGVLVSIAYVSLMALPLFIVIADPAITTANTVAVYAAGLIADVVAFFVLLALALRYSSRAARGELFAIPLVGSLTDRIFRLRR